MQTIQNDRGLVAAEVSTIVAGGIIGAMSVAFAISFVAVIYSGPLSGYLGNGIGLALMGAAIMALLGGWLYRSLGTLCQPQETIAILMAAAAAGISGNAAASDMGALGPTVAMLGIVATMVAGLVALLCGQMRLGHVARYIPHPVLGGFLVASGYVLVLGAIGLCLGRHVDFWTLPGLFQPGEMERWGPWLALSLALAIGLRRVTHDMALPIALLAITGGFYLVLAITGQSLAEASATGLLLGPFPTGQTLLPDLVSMARVADWSIILAQAPTILSVAGTCLVGTILNTSGLELALGRKSDLNHDLRTTGIVNIAAAAGGGVGGYPMIGETLLAARLGLRGMAPGLAVALVCAGVAVFGAEALATLPKGLFATVIGYLGSDLLITWLWREGRTLRRRDTAIMVVILMVAAVAGILEAILVGLGVAAAIFVLSYARLNPVRRATTGALRRSIVERPAQDLDLLSRDGQAVLILELTGYLFFGTAHKLLERLQTELAAGHVKELVLDFAHVSGMDVSARRTLETIRGHCTARGVQLILVGMRPGVLRHWVGKDRDVEPALTSRLDDALPAIEDRLLANCARAETTAMQEFPVDLQLAEGEAMFRSVELDIDGVLLHAGDASDEMFVLRQGALRAEVSGADGAPIVVARFLPGALIGEIAFYTGQPRTATVIADEPSTLVRIDAGALASGDPALSAAFHAAIARRLAVRLTRTTRLVRDLTA